MTHTHFHQDLHQIVKNRAYSYAGNKGTFESAPLNYANVGATSLFTTATDLTKWLDNFREPLIGGKSAIARITEQAVLSSGKKIDYALGVSIGKQRGLPTISHAGGDAGFRSYVCWYPDQQLGVAVVSNLGSFNPVTTADKVAAVYLESKMTPVLPRSSGPSSLSIPASSKRWRALIPCRKLVKPWWSRSRAGGSSLPVQSSLRLR